MIEIQSQSRASLSVAVSYHNCCSKYLQPGNNLKNDICFAVSLGLVAMHRNKPNITYLLGAGGLMFFFFFGHSRCAEFNATCPQAGRNLHALYDFQ